MERFETARVKVALEICKQSGQVPRRFDFFKFFGGIEHFRHLGKIGRIIRAQENFAAGREGSAGQRGESFVDKPVFLVPLFGPGIGKVNMNG